MSFLNSPDAAVFRKNSVKNMRLLFSEDKSKSQLQPPQAPSVPAPASNSSSTESLKVQSDSINDDDTPWRRSNTRIKVEDTTPKIRKFF